MKERLTDGQIETIRKRAEAASVGPWIVDSYDGTIRTDDGRHIRVCDTSINSNGNADFIANARTDIPALLAEVVRLRTFVERVSNPLDIKGIAEDGRMVEMKNVVFDFETAVIRIDSEK